MGEIRWLILAVVLQLAYQFLYGNIPAWSDGEFLLSWIGMDSLVPNNASEVVAKLQEGANRSRRYRVRTMHGFLNVHLEPGDPFRTDNVVGRLLEGEVVETVGEVMDTDHGPWVQTHKGWSIARHAGFQWLQLITDDFVSKPATDSSEVIILDDDDATARGAWHAGVYEPCLADAFRGMFHPDWGQGKGQLHAAYPFELSSAGCYAVDEWHPGGKNRACAAYLTRVHVEVRLGGSSVLPLAAFAVDQSDAGG